MEIDVAVCTKDRYDQLPQCISQIRREIPLSKLIIIDSSPHPNMTLLNSFNAEVVLTPNAKLGYARQQALTHSTSDVLAFLDDDVKLAPQWYMRMWNALHSDPKTVAVSSRIIYGWQSDRVIEKLTRCGFRLDGGSIGISMLNRKKILEIGGFNVNVHRGEDTELHIRINQHGFRWIREHMAVAYHRMMAREYWQKATANADGWVIIWRTLRSRLNFVSRRFGSALIMPIYYGMLTLDLRVTAVYMVYKWRILLAFLRKAH